mgnify:CR=1 FL=1
MLWLLLGASGGREVRGGESLLGMVVVIFVGRVVGGWLCGGGVFVGLCLLLCVVYICECCRFFCSMFLIVGVAVLGYSCV